MDDALSTLEIEFPPGVYSDVRLEHTIDHDLTMRDGQLLDMRKSTETGAFLRVQKNGFWYFASTTELDQIDAILAELAASDALGVGPNPSVENLLEAHRETVRAFDGDRVDAVPFGSKLSLIRGYAEQLDRPSIKTWTARWVDQHRERRFVSSHGADVSHDYQEAGFILEYLMSHDDQSLHEGFTRAEHSFSALVAAAGEHSAQLSTYLDRCERFVAEAVPVEPGPAAVVLAPVVAGVFAHESFGHKSEADFMLGDSAMLAEWQIGMRVAKPLLSIVDSGQPQGSGYMPFDDEGQRSTTTYLIKDGILAGRLHAAHTAVALRERPTANARAMSFRFEPIVRMTTTWIEAGDDTFESLLAGVDDGYFIETVKHGSGMSTFTIAPGLCWRIREGKLGEPVRIGVLTGTVFETMGEIDGLSDRVERPFLVGGGCGKFEQWPLSVGYGGPYVRIRRMNIA